MTMIKDIDWKDFESVMRPRLGEKTIALYIRTLKSFPESLDLLDIEATNSYLRALLDKKDPGPKKNGNKRNTVALKRNIISSAYIYYFGKRDLTGKGGALLTVKTEKPKAKWFTKDQIDELVEMPATIEDRLILRLLFESGVRIDEFMNIRIHDINMRTSTINVMEPGKGGSLRQVYFTEKTKSLMAEHMDGMERGQLLFDYSYLKHPDGHFRDTVVKKWAIKAGLPNWASPHKMRHSVASYMIEGGVPLKYVSEYLGHSNIQTTANTYGHVRPKKIKEQFDELFKE